MRVRWLPFLLVVGAGCGATRDAEPDLTDRGTVVLGWDAGLRPLGRAASDLERYAPVGGRDVLAAAAPAYFERPDVEAADAAAWRRRATDACAALGGEVVGWAGDLPRCRAEGVEIQHVPRRAALRAPGPDGLLSEERIGAAVAQGLVTCNDEGEALVGWTRFGEWMLPLCGPGSGHVTPWIPPAPARVLDTCTADVDGDGEVELAVLIEGGARDHLGVLDGDLRHALDEGSFASDATRVTCRAGHVGLGPQRAPEVRGYAWTGQGFEPVGAELPG